MVNRTLQAKRLKAKKHRYQSPTRYAPNPGWTEEYHARAQVTSSFDRWFFKIDHVPDDVTNESNNARRAELGLPGSWSRSAKEQILRFIDTPVEHTVCLEDCGWKILLCWSYKPERYWLVFRDEKDLKKSCVYYSRPAAMRAFNKNRVIWVSKIRVD